MISIVDSGTVPTYEPATLVDVLRRRASASPDQVAYTFIDDEHERQLTYGGLDRQAAALAGWLRQRVDAQARVLVCCGPGLEAIVALFGCMYAGLVAIPAAPPDPARRHRTLLRLRTTVRDARPALVLSGKAVLEAARPALALAPELEQLPWHAVEAILDQGAPPAPAPALAGDALAMLMYTSGSTGAPKGVMVSHGNIMHNVVNFPGFDARPCRTIVSWLPLYHDLGLFMGVAHPLYRGVPAVLLDPAAFIQRPLRWLEAISRFRATTSGGPNFAYDLCARKITPDELARLDLSHWNLALNGAEPIRPQVLERFAAAFAPCGFRAETFYPSYGMSDATATVTGPVTHSAPALFNVDRAALLQNRVAVAAEGGRTLVGCGHILRGQELAIVDPDTCQRCAPDAVGEVWLRGPSVAQGYWGQPAATDALFHAAIAGSGEGPFLRTGDLGFIHADELYLVGRSRDRIIIRGENHYPEDIELTIEDCHPAFPAGGGAVFALDGAVEERLVVVQELRGGDEATADAAMLAVRRAVAAEHGVQVSAIILIPKGSLPKTSSGKIARQACKAAYSAGDLVALHSWRREDTPAASQSAPPNAGAVLVWLRDAIQSRLHVAPAAIDLDAPFSHYGLDSLQALELVGDLSHFLGRTLSPTILWDYPTIASLAAFVQTNAGQRRPLLGEILADARHLTAAQLDAALEEQGRSPLSERLGEILVRRRLITASQLRAALLRQVGVADLDTDAAASAEQEPIAIIGLSCRFPGVSNADAFWRMLRDGVDAITEIPPDRWDMETFYSPDRSTPGTMYTRWGGFLDDLDQMDAAFFQMSPREAAHLDPQQRLLMEVAWEALEDAGQVPSDLSGTPTGVFVSTIGDDYSRMIFSDLRSVEPYSGTGGAHSILANRLSYLFNFRGPSLALDTACSGALVAIHLACQSLRSGEATLALAGGVNVNLLPDGNIFFSKAGALSPDGRCKAFDAKANGIVRSEGVGLVVLKPLSRALADGDQIYALVRGSAVNQDGRTNGIMAPNRQSQEAVLRAAYLSAGVAPHQVQYIEAHGTGTSLGDVIEAQALGAVLAPGRGAEAPCRIGSVKTNIGHTEAAAGIASVIKVALALKHRQIPPSLHVETPNPMIPFAELGLQIQQALSDWPAADAPALAGVSGFGFGGTNAHLVLEGFAAPAPAPQPAPVAAILPLSAQTPAALRGLAGAYRDLLASPADPSGLATICANAAVRRTHHSERIALTGADSAALVAALDAYLSGEPHEGLSVGAGGQPPRAVFVFSGQGSYWLGMGRALLAREPIFAAAIEACERSLRQHVGWSLRTVLSADALPEQLQGTDVVQPATFAVQVALAALWRAWGVEPSAIVGHSLGEVAAAHVAGALSLDDAVRVVYHRSRLMKSVAGQGATAAIELPPEQARLLLVGREHLLAVAGSNSPSSCVIAGDAAELARVVQSLEQQQVFARMLRGVDIAFHSPQMDPLKPELAAALADIRPQPNAVPLISTVTGKPCDGRSLDAAYWANNLREPFRFADATHELLSQGYGLFLEVSPHPVLAESIVRSGQHWERPVAVVSSLRRNSDAHATLYGALGALYGAGAQVRWGQVLPAVPVCSGLPAYPWQRERFWIDQVRDGDAPASSALRSVRQTAPAGTHPLLGVHLRAAQGDQHFWQQAFSTARLPYLQDHQVQGTTILPGAAYVEMGLAAARAAFGARPCRIGSVVFNQALFVPETGARVVQASLAPVVGAAATFQIASTSEAAESWVVHASGVVHLDENGAPATPSEPLADIQARCVRTIADEAHYGAMRERGLVYGPRFQAIKQIWRCDGEALGQLVLPAELRDQAYLLHPVLLDAAFQIVAATLPEGGPNGDTFLPAGVQSFQVHAAPTDNLWCHAILRTAPDHSLDSHEADLTLRDAAGNLVAEVVGLHLQRLGSGAQRSAPARPEETLYAIEWEAAPTAAGGDWGGSWLIFGDKQGVGQELASRLAAQGARCTLVTQNADAPHEIPALIRAAVEEAAPTRVVYLWALDATVGEGLPAEALLHAQASSCDGVLALVRAAQRLPQAPRLWLATRGAQAVAANEAPAIGQASVWGMGRVLLHEHPELRPRLVDLDPAAGEAAAALLLAVGSHDDEAQIAVRGGQRLAARLRPTRPSQASPWPPRFRPDGSYLITGGMGGLGLEVARWMVERGARRLILTGRTPLPPRSAWQAHEPTGRVGQIIVAVRALEEMGASVHLAAVDCADEAQMAAFLGAHRREGWPPIRGVIHAAGVLRDQLLTQMDHDGLRAVLQPKVAGAWNLHTLLRDEPLDHFVLFSSLASVLGSVGQGNYAAGNAFLDALAHHRRALGLAGTSINWGPWTEVGMAARAGINAQLQAQGLSPLSPQQGLAALQHLLQNPAAQATVLDIDWARWMQANPHVGNWPLLREIRAQHLAAPAAGALGASAAPFARRLLEAAPAERPELLEQHLQSLVARVLRVGRDRLPPELPLRTFGLDSIMCIELKNSIEATVEQPLTIAYLLQGPSIREIAEALLAQVDETPALDDDALVQLLAELEQLTPEEAELLLAAN